MVLQLMWRKDFLFLSRKLCGLCFWMALLHSMSYFFFLNQSPSLPLCTVFDAISSNVDDVLSVNPPANVFFFAWYEEVPPSYSGLQGPVFLPLNIIMCRRFEPLFKRHPLPYWPPPLFIFFLNLSLLARLFWQDCPNEIPNKHKNKHMGYPPLPTFSEKSWCPFYDFSEIPTPYK